MRPTEGQGFGEDYYLRLGRGGFLDPMRRTGQVFALLTALDPHLCECKFELGCVVHLKTSGCLSRNAPRHNQKSEVRKQECRVRPSLRGFHALVAQSTPTSALDE